jgi:hypothetical protein
MAKFNSVATLAFVVHHDNEDECTHEEFLAGLMKRLMDLTNPEEADTLVDACGSDFFDTHETETPVDTKDDVIIAAKAFVNSGWADIYHAMIPNEVVEMYKDFELKLKRVSTT